MPIEAPQIRFPLSAQWLERARTAVSEALQAESPELRAAALLAASELAENVIKFGRPTPDSADGALDVALVAGELRISSANGATPERFQHLAALIERITSSADRELLYLERLNAMLRAGAGDSTGIGLIRVAHEGKFSLSCRYDEPRLTIVATRRLA
jgi:hypothetical protein